MRRPLPNSFFDRDPRVVARQLVGCVLWRGHGESWLAASVVEAEAYRKNEKGSHASLGRTPSREALFMPAGTLYLYYARGGDSLNISCAGEGNGVLVKGACLYRGDGVRPDAEKVIRRRLAKTKNPKPQHRLLSGQTLLCRGLDLKVPHWTEKPFDPEQFFASDEGDTPEKLVQCRRIGIPEGRDEHLMYRWVDERRLHCATKNPITKSTELNKDYRFVARG